MTKAHVEPNLNEVVTLFKDYSGDETGGIHAIRGFSFQVWQGVLEALKAHATGQDYAVVLEWQQDIAVLDSSTKPTRATFIQLKKNESSHNWTLHGLVTPVEAKASKKQPNTEGEAAKKTRKKPPPQSILAKLYFHRRRFTKVAPTTLVFASNAPFFVGVDGDAVQTLTAVQLKELPKAPLAKLNEALRTQLQVPAEEAIDLSDFSLEVTNCPLDDAHKYAIGELVQQCLFRKIEPHVTAPFVAVCLIASYIQQKAGSRFFAKDFDALLSRAVTRSDINAYLAAANDSHVSTQDQVNRLIARLNAEVADFDLVQDMEKQLNAACAEITNRASSVWTSVRELYLLYGENGGYKAHRALKDRLPAWLTDFRKSKPEGSTALSDGYLFCLMSMIIQNARPIQHLSAAAPGAELEAKQ